MLQLPRRTTACCGLPQVKFELVSEEELEKQRKDFRNGELKLRIDEEEFNMRCGPALLCSSAAPGLHCLLGLPSAARCARNAYAAADIQ